jgi:hypothetical protein
MQLIPTRDEYKDWLISGSGPVAIFISASVTLGITAYLYGLTAMHIDDRSFRLMPAYFQDVSNLFGAIGAAGSLTVYYSMWFYWREVDASRAGKKRLWFFALLFGLWYGSCVYYYCVYRPQVAKFRRDVGN